ncbi:MAG: membrane protein insertase YidC [Proteobacteria bacterium]|nr:membrane protein insertase YidC [Pseudomonadota bacterium]
MDKRAIIAIILSMLVIIIWQLIFAPSPKEPSVIEEQEEQPAIEARREEVPKESRDEEVPTYTERDESNVRDVVVETPLYRAVLTTAGARLKSWALSEYMDSKKSIVLWRRKEVDPPQPIEMVPGRGLKDLPLATQLRLNGGVERDLVFDVDTAGLTVESDSVGSLVFVGQTEEGLEVVKRFWFNSDQYRIDLEVELINRADRPMNPQLTMIWSGVVAPGGRYTFSGPSVLSAGEVARLKPKEIRKGRTFTENVKWMASDDNYFLSMVAPQEADAVRVDVQGREIPETEGVGFENRLTFPEKKVMPGGHEKFSFLIYIGPKLPELLKGLDIEAEKAINFGKWLGSIEKGLLFFLEFTHGLTGNYGVDIIILSILLKIVFWPLSRKSYKSMQEMQKIQPEMKMLQEKYKNDRERLNQEMMALYKRRKVNPVGGCLPMLVQFPFLIALYKALPLSFNLRHAPFVLWLQDLSAADTFFVDELPLPILGNTPVGPLPLLMGVSMLLQQKMSPTMGDPRQAKMMMIMPIMFIFIFLGFPSGLVLYWFVQNLLSIGEQYYTKRKGS